MTQESQAVNHYLNPTEQRENQTMTHPGELLRQEKLYAGKEMGQNFLSHPATARMIVERTGVSKTATVLEVGPGLGALTIPLARQVKQVIAVEKDSRLIPLLESELDKEKITNVTLIKADILKTDLAALAKGEKLVVMGNLPYNISSQILFQLIKKRQVVDRAFLMFQKELAVRIMASPGGRDYSRLSAVVQYAAHVSMMAQISPASFFPRPAVDSTVLRFDFFLSPDTSKAQEELLFAVIKAAFSKRRKTLRNAMTKGELGLDRPVVSAALERAGILPERRAETLSVDEFKALARAIRDLR